MISTKEFPLDYGAKFPEYYFSVPTDERDERIEVSNDLCIVDDEFFFIRGLIEIPIINEDDYFAWGVWCSLSEKSFNRVLELWDIDNVEDEEPFFGWLNTALPESVYPDTLSLKTDVHWRNDNQRPFIEVQPSENLLAVE